MRACGDYVPLVAEVESAPAGVWIRLHDPDRHGFPRRSGVQLDDPATESGRGLPLTDLLAPGWDATPTPVGKQICGLVRHGGG
ncbi:hypothetical protein ABT115_00120 [Streptomyces sp. NPDC001832]|uniref:hypothetical protein n=1 Tax=Streptomyces sp. NPDC001832 TaxID=3154527 RepID=UPI00331FD11A